MEGGFKIETSSGECPPPSTHHVNIKWTGVPTREGP